MISKKLKLLFLSYVALAIIHGSEEFYTDFYKIDSHAKFVFGYFYSLPSLTAVFLVFQIMLWLTLIVFFLSIISERSRIYLMIIPGIIFIYEMHHIYKAFLAGGYYPGVITALLFPILGFFYSKELINNFKDHGKQNIQN